MAPVRPTRETSRFTQGPAVDLRSHVAGLRTVASIEAFKGVLAILLTVCLLFLLHKDVEQIASELLDALHIRPEHAVSHAVMHAAHGLTDRRLWEIAAGALAYSAVRFVEAYGLWNRRVWAEWFALLSGSLYIPLEITTAIEHPDLIHFSVLVINVIIVLYMLWVRLSSFWWQRSSNFSAQE